MAELGLQLTTVMRRAAASTASVSNIADQRP
jgi:hypothetical protein